MTVALARRLVWSGLALQEDVDNALLEHAKTGVALLDALLRKCPDAAPRLERQLLAGPPLRGTLTRVPELEAALPPRMCEQLLALPIERERDTRAIVVATPDPTDAHIAAEFAFHLGCPVRLVAAPLGALTALLSQGSAGFEQPPGSARQAPMPTPAFGVGVPVSERGPATPRLSQPPSPPLNPRPSDAPIPLVRVTAGGSKVVTAASIAARPRGGGSPVVVPPRPPSDPPIALTRPKKSAPQHEPPAPPTPSAPKQAAPPSAPIAFKPPPSKAAAPASAPPSRPPWSNRASPPSAPPMPRVSSRPPPKESVKPSAPAHSIPPPVSAPEGAPLGEIIETLRTAASPDDVAHALVRGLGTGSSKVIVLACRPTAFHGRDASSNLPTRNMIRSLAVTGEQPSVLRTAVAMGQYLGPLPRAAPHADLDAALGHPSGEVAIVPVLVSSRPTLLMVVTDFDNPFMTTRRAETLARAAGEALERIVRERRK